MVYVVAHRGASGIAPENTLKAFRKAIALGADYLEFDVRMTRDGHAVVMHDPRVDRTTDGSGRLRDLDFADVRALDAGEGERVPTVTEVLEAARGKVRLLCELKGRGVEDIAVDLVQAAGMEAEVIFTSFRFERLMRVKKRNAALNVGAILNDPGDSDIRHAIDLGAVNIGIRYDNLSRDLVERVKATGIDLRAWNPDRLEDQIATMALGVDGIGTNRPDRLIDYLKRQGLRSG